MKQDAPHTSIFVCDDLEDKNDVFSFIDKTYQANLGKMTAGISPAALGTAYFSWMAQLIQSPGTLLEVMMYPWLNSKDFYGNLATQIKPAAGKDVRFHTDNWELYPWRLWAELFLHLEKWCLCSATDVPGLPPHVTYRGAQVLNT